MREALEIGASKAVIEGASDAELRKLETHLAAMEDAWERGADYLVGAVHDLAFHRALVSLSGNGRMAAMQDQMLTQTALLLRTAAEGNPTLRTGIKRSAHRDIYEALLAREPERTRAAIEAHYRYAEERLYAGLPSPGGA